MSEKYIFILGNNPKLSVAEIKAVLPEIKTVKVTDRFFIGEIDELDCQKTMSILGGTIKIGKVISDSIDKDQIIENIKSRKGESKVKYGFSFYDTKPNRVGMEIKKELKEMGISSRLVVAKEKFLSAVIVKKNKVIDFLVLPDFIGLTCAVQEFEAYGKRDYGRPKSDAYSGMLPPKLARIMINLSQADDTSVLFDPFCGSGTVLTEAIDLGYKNIIGSDISEKAVSDTTENVNWLLKELGIDDLKLNIFKADVKDISKSIEPLSVDVIVAEPYLGPPIRGHEDERAIKKTIKELENLYIPAFRELHKILKPDGKIVIVIPSWHLKNEFHLDIDGEISQIGFKRINKEELVYKRESQKVWRNIRIWQKK